MEQASSGAAFNNISASPAECQQRQVRFHRFLNEFTAYENHEMEYSSQTSAVSGGQANQPHRVYVEQLHMMKERELSTLYVNFDHLVEYDEELAMDIVGAYYRMEPFLQVAIRNFVREHLDTYAERDDGAEKEFWLSLHNLGETDRLRSLRSDKIGVLTQFIGTVTRTTEVRPELFLGAFRCIECMTVVKDVQQQFKYTPPTICSNPTCQNTSKWTLVQEESVFVDWQKAKVQENPDEVPAGSLPRTLDVILRNDIVETVRPGDKAVFAGTLVVVPDVAALTAPGERLQTRLSGVDRSTPMEGITNLRNGPARTGVRELTYKLAFIAGGITPVDQRGGMVNIRTDDETSPEEVLAQFSNEQRNGLEEMRRDRALYDRMAASISPNVFGHMDVKRAVLLMLLGGVQKKTKEGIKLRGDINVAIVGDPACAKSQILKYVAGFLPRAVYTSGKSSSAAGLTASVVRESDSGEFCIEAGALMLADNGICCIDEFDKMDVKDQVAIHEAMEQQTISIAKAGIQASLNARTSILAAANPVAGRYDRSKPLRYNVALPPAILSRFDLLHVMIDDPDPHADAQIANHILSVHQGAGAALNPPYNTERMQCYLKYARSIKPRLSEAAQKQLVASYRRLRADDAAPGSNASYRITVRQLEALVRLSEALARLHLRDEVTRGDVREAYRLVKNSIAHVEAPDAELAEDELLEDIVAADDIMEGVELPREADEAGGNVLETEASPSVGGRGSSEAAAATEGPHAEGEGQAAANEAGGERAVTKVSQAKLTNVRNLLVMRLRELERKGLDASSEPTDARRIDAGPEGSELVGATQRDLLKWYFDYLVAREAVQSREQGVQEIILAEKIITHLVRREKVLMVLEMPQREDGESAAEFMKRLQLDRVLGIHPNYAGDM